MVCDLLGGAEAVAGLAFVAVAVDAAAGVGGIGKVNGRAPVGVACGACGAGGIGKGGMGGAGIPVVIGDDIGIMGGMGGKGGIIGGKGGIEVNADAIAADIFCLPQEGSWESFQTGFLQCLKCFQSVS